MKIDKSLISGSTSMLVLKLVEERDRYGYEIIEELARRSDHTFEFKAGTLYPVLHALEENGWIVSYESCSESKRIRKYYQITKQGRKALEDKKKEWEAYTEAVNRTLGGVTYEG